MRTSNLTIIIDIVFINSRPGHRNESERGHSILATAFTPPDTPSQMSSPIWPSGGVHGPIDFCSAASGRTAGRCEKAGRVASLPL